MHRSVFVITIPSWFRCQPLVAGYRTKDSQNFHLAIKSQFGNMFVCKFFGKKSNPKD